MIVNQDPTDYGAPSASPYPSSSTPTPLLSKIYKEMLDFLIKELMPLLIKGNLQAIIGTSLAFAIKMINSYDFGNAKHNYNKDSTQNDISS